LGGLGPERRRTGRVRARARTVNVIGPTQFVRIERRSVRSVRNIPGPIPRVDLFAKPLESPRNKSASSSVSIGEVALSSESGGGRSGCAVRLRPAGLNGLTKARQPMRVSSIAIILAIYVAASAFG